jgi:hypothetical protein
VFLRGNFILPKTTIMNTTTTLFVSAGLLLLASCTKTSLDDIHSAKKNGYFFNTWIIDDDNQSNHNNTQSSNTFIGKYDPHLTIKSNYDYSLRYGAAASGYTTEEGSCTVDEAKKTITLSPKGGTPCEYGIVAISEEVLTLKATYTKTVTTTNSEGVSSVTTNTLTETLYLEDND